MGRSKKTGKKTIGPPPPPVSNENGNAGYVNIHDKLELY
jgi:hypothetical protein